MSSFPTSKEAPMKRFFCLAILMMLSSSAYASSFSFVVAGHAIHIEAPRHCRSASCVSVSIPGIHETNGRRDRHDDAVDAPVVAAVPVKPVDQAPAAAVAPAKTAPATVQPSNTAPATPPTPVAPAASIPPAPPAVAAPPPAPKPIQAVAPSPPSTVQAARTPPATAPSQKPAEAARPP